MSVAAAAQPRRRVLYDHHLQQPGQDEGDAPAGWNAERVEPPDILSIAIALSPLVHSINTIFIFLLIFQTLEHGHLSPTTLILGCLLSLLIARILWSLVISPRGKGAPTIRTSSAPSIAVSFVILLLLLYALSPVLKTLTEATSSDTIYPLSLMLFGLHVCLGNNTLAPKSTKKGSGRLNTPRSHSNGGQRNNIIINNNNNNNGGMTRSFEDPPQLFSALSLNAATSASLVLASRLPSNSHVFALLLTSILSFALFPIYLRKIQNLSLRIASGSLSIPISLTFASSISDHLLLLALAINLFLLLVVPVCMNWVSRGRVRFDGPWRVAKPHLRKRRYSAL